MGRILKVNLSLFNYSDEKYTGYYSLIAESAAASTAKLTSAYDDDISASIASAIKMAAFEN